MSENLLDFNNDYSGIRSITLKKGLYLESGVFNNPPNSISIETTGDTIIFTVPASALSGWDTASIKFRLLGSNITGTLIMSVGTNSPNYDNIMPSTPFTGIATIGDIFRYPCSGSVARILSGQAVYARVTNAVSGTGAIINATLVGEME